MLPHATPDSRQLVRRTFFAALCADAILGLAIAIWMHGVALLGGDPRDKVMLLIVCQLSMGALILPVFFLVKPGRLNPEFMRIPRWARIVIYVLLVHYAIQFYVFMYLAAQELRGRDTWRMYSSGLILYFTVAASYYGARASETK